MVFSSGASTMFTKSKWPSVAHCALTVAPSCSTSLLTSRMRAGLFLTVWTPSGVRVESMMYVGMPRLYPILSAPCGVLSGMRVLPLAALLVLALAAPAAAAPTMDPLKRCYAADGDAPNQRETVHVHATGFTPAAHVDLLIDNQLQLTGQADINGAVTAQVPAPFQGVGQRPFFLTLQEQENTTNFVTVSSLVTNLSVTLRPKRARPSRKVRFSGRGFTLDAPVFGHYVFGGKLRKTVRLARRPVQPCGIFHAKRRQIPVRRPTPGDWLLQVDQQRRYSPHPASNTQPVLIRVRETFKKP